jgi:hypothetical protein
MVVDTTPQNPSPFEGQVVSYGGESPAVVLLEFYNGNATLRYTLRAVPGEDEYSLHQRAMNFIRAIDQSAGIDFKYMDAPKASYSRGGGGAASDGRPRKSETILGNRLEAAYFDYTERPNKNDPSKPWGILRVYDETKTRFAEILLGMKIVQETGLFPVATVKQLPHGQLQPMPQEGVIVNVEKGNYGYNIKGFEF